MGIAGAKRTSEVKEIRINEKENIYIVGRRYVGDDWTQRATFSTYKRLVQVRAAQEKEDYAELIRLKNENGLDTICDYKEGEEPFLYKIFDKDGITITGAENIKRFLRDEGYSYLQGVIDDKLDASSEEFSLSEEDAIEEGKRLLSIFGGGGKQSVQAKA